MRTAFSLVELSVVLVILGLITGGILGGQAMIKAAELRSVTTEYNRYSTAATNFRDKYAAMPGDFPGATQAWGRMSSVGAVNCTTNSSAAVNAAGACDGNGSDAINGAAGASQSGEIFQFWRHLVLAGYIEGTFSGLSGSGGYMEANATNIPKARYGQAYWNARSLTGYFAGDAGAYAGEYGNFFDFGGLNGASYPFASVLTPEDAWNIDKKLDDGRPGTGFVLSRGWNNTCATPDDGATFTSTNLAASYKLDTKTTVCALEFVRAF